MKVSTYLRPSTEGKSNVYLDYYVNSTRQRKKTGLFVYDKSKTRLEKDHNKETNQMIEAMKAELTLKIQRNEVGFDEPKKAHNDFVKYYKYLLDKRERSGTNYSGWKSAYKHLCNYSPNGLHFNQLNSDYLEDLKLYLTDEVKLKGTSAQRYFDLIKHAVHEAFRDRLIIKDYADKVKSPKREEPIKNYLSDAELTMLAKTECSNPVLKRAFLFSCLTGMSFADVLILHWTHITTDVNGDWQIVFHRKKTKGLQYHPISKEALSILGDIQKTDTRIFAGLRYHGWNNSILKQWVYLSGIKKNITFHCARHTYATLLLSKGADLTVVQELLGHKDIKTTRIYAKVIDKNKRAASNLLSINGLIG